MRWVRYRSSVGPRLGLVLDDTIHGLVEPVDLVDLLAQEEDGLERATREATTQPLERTALDDATLMAPLVPTTLRDYVCFVEHIKNAPIKDGSERPVDGELSIFERIPCFAWGNPGAVVGAKDDVTPPPGCTQFDFELEVAAVVGTPGENIAPDDGEAHIAGYMIFCDWSARNLQEQARTSGMGGQKGKDCANTLGPFFVTADELIARREGRSFNLEMTAELNGERIGGGNLSEMYWSFGELVAWSSRGAPIRAGDVLASGTVPTGCLYERAKLDGDAFRGYLEAGDEVRLSVAGLGETRQRVTERAWAPALRTGY